MGSSHSCALDATFLLVLCWGRNTEKQTDMSILNQAIRSLNNSSYTQYQFLKIDAGNQHTCALFMYYLKDIKITKKYRLGVNEKFKDNKMVCWGSNN
jgi:hypothetical protein